MLQCSFLSTLYCENFTLKLKFFLSLSLSLISLSLFLSSSHRDNTFFATERLESNPN